VLISKVPKELQAYPAFLAITVFPV
jgi:hypothetical protein